MILSNNIDIDKNAIVNNLNRITNQIYKLLPSREENLDWETPLNTIIEELSGMSKLLYDYHEIIFSLLCKLEGLYELKDENKFFYYRRTIFDCLNLVYSLKKEILSCQD